MKNRWPWPKDTALDRRTCIARQYRQDLMEIDPERCAARDRMMAELGETWIVPVVKTTDEARLRLSECAAQLGVKPGTLWQWANRGVVPREADGRFDLAAVQRALAERRARRTAA